MHVFIGMRTNTSSHVPSIHLAETLAPIEGLDSYGECQAAAEPAKDFFQFVPLTERGLLISVGEMFGHGTGPAIVTAGLKASLRSLSGQWGRELTATVQALNRSLCDICPSDFYATLFCAEIDPLTRRLRYVSAAHESALPFRQRSRHVRRLPSTATVLGLTARAQFREQFMLLEAGDVLVVCSDGVTDISRRDGVELRERGVRLILGAVSMELSSRIMEATDEFRSGLPPADEQTVVVARLISPAASTQAACFASELALAAS